jgi:hypothetical protein
MLCAMIVLLGVVASLQQASSEIAPLHLEPGQRQLMIDGSLLDDASSANRAGGTAPVLRMHPAHKTGQLVIVADKPWEGVIFYYDSIVQVSESEFRIYYECVLANAPSPPSSVKHPDLLPA